MTTPNFFGLDSPKPQCSLNLPVLMNGQWYSSFPVAHEEHKESPFLGTRPSSAPSPFSFGVVKSPSEQNANDLKNPEQQEKSFTEKFTFTVENERKPHDIPFGNPNPFGSNPFGKPSKVQELTNIIQNSYTILATPTIDGHWTISQLHGKQSFGLISTVFEKSVTVDRSTWEAAQTSRVFGKGVEWKKINDHYFVGLC